jgi:hypothetical protein
MVCAAVNGATAASLKNTAENVAKAIMVLHLLYLLP